MKTKQRKQVDLGGEMDGLQCECEVKSGLEGKGG
jgi:hypothetical protein